MADTEMEAGPSKTTASESAPEGPPPKKKRTRTLTTPHQAAVLHALLAQVRLSPAALDAGRARAHVPAHSPGSPPRRCARRSDAPSVSVLAKCRCVPPVVPATPPRNLMFAPVLA